MKIRQLTPPEGLLAALEKRRLHYSSAEQLMYQLWVGESCIGVFGDPDNASYEWFVWTKETLRHSDCGYGDSSIALFDVMKAEMADYV